MNPRPSLLLSLLAGAVGMTLILGVWHLYTDHQKLHAIWDLELRRAQQAQGGPPAAPAGGS